MAFLFATVAATIGLTEEQAKELDSNPKALGAIESYATDTATNQVLVAKDEFKKKMDALDTKVKAAEDKAKAFDGVDADELEALKQAKDKNPELQATLEAMKKKSEEQQAAFDTQTNKLKEAQFTMGMAQEINAYNTTNPTVSVKSDMVDIVNTLAAQAIKIDDEGNFKVHDKDGNVLATAEGVATPQDWFATLRKDRPSLFNVPTGSGASGSQNSGSATKPIDKSKTSLSSVAPADLAAHLKAQKEGNE